MSTYYAFSKNIAAQDMFDGRLEAFGVHECHNEHTTEDSRLLTDGRNYLRLSIRDGLVAPFRGWGPGKILGAIIEAFDVMIVSEHEPQFYGFNTEEEWDAWEAARDAMRKADDEKFHTELLKFLKGEPHDITPGIRMERTEIAKKLVEEDPALLLPTNKSKLHVAIAIYEREHDPDVPF
jgi:hypothetical protein